VVFEAAATVSGPTSRRFTRTLRGAGEVLGVKFRPAMFSCVCERPASALADRVLPLASVLPSGPTWAAAVERAPTLEAKLRACEGALTPLVRPIDPLVCRLRDLTEAIEHDRSLVRVGELARRAGLHSRTLERAFRRYVGKSPKWVLRRYRLIDAAERLAGGDGATIAVIAQDVGYYDQAHFARDFRALVGVSPSAIRKPPRQSSASSR
jgi:AraC-like DNA-binding protein